MTIRSRRETVTFRHPFRIRGIERLLPAGAYEVVTDEETIEGLTFSAYRRIATMITVPTEAPHTVRWRCCRSARSTSPTPRPPMPSAAP